MAVKGLILGGEGGPDQVVGHILQLDRIPVLSPVQLVDQVSANIVNLGGHRNVRRREGAGFEIKEAQQEHRPQSQQDDSRNLEHAFPPSQPTPSGNRLHGRIRRKLVHAVAHPVTLPFRCRNCPRLTIRQQYGRRNGRLYLAGRRRRRFLKSGD